MGFIITEPTLFYTDDGVYFFADTVEEWTITQVVSRIISPQTTQIWRAPLPRLNNASFVSCKTEIMAMTELIEEYGLNYPDHCIKIYQKE